ncbi:MAG: methionyl-tRNA formyltransferase [Thiobacillaceae bacterium]|nr:methionyl-tRNA formyltransferase [Thiobacillaceae bacterium]MDW8322907.1 methionyl-tRNA formyltransferase [Burkholderiales bacterium]
MRLIFAGTPEFAAASLRALAQAGHDIALVLTQPDRPAGRGMQPRPSAVKRLALELGLPLHQPATLASEEARRPIAAAAAEVMVVAAYGLILPPAVLALPRLGCVNIHASLLPRWRGAAPIQRAILAGDAETGITLMQMDAGLDTGPILAMARIPIAADDTAGSLQARLAELGAQEIVRLLPRLAAGEVQAVPQDDARAVYAAKIGKAEARIDWGRPAAEIERQVRAFDPVPGAWTTWRGEGLKLWRARIETGAGVPGEVLAVDRGGLQVACGEGALRILELQPAGGRRMTAAEFAAGHRLAPGERLNS